MASSTTELAQQQLAPTYALLDIAMRRSIKARSDDIDVPDLGAAARIGRGLAVYVAHCQQCHGGPGVAPEPFALGLRPVPANLAFTGREWPPAEIFWVVKHGLKMTGMPAWEFRLSEQALWDVVAFVRVMPQWSPAEYRSRSAAVADRGHQDFPGKDGAGRSVRPDTTDADVVGVAGDPKRGRLVLNQYACVTCHRIPGVVGGDTPVGPPLAGMGNRSFIAGLLPNTPANMMRWLQAPQDINPDSAMPDLGVTERDARDMAAYLGTLEDPP